MCARVADVCQRPMRRRGVRTDAAFSRIVGKRAIGRILMILPEACEQRSTAHWRGPALRRPRRRAISYQRTTSASLVTVAHADDHVVASAVRHAGVPERIRNQWSWPFGTPSTPLVRRQTLGLISQLRECFCPASIKHGKLSPRWSVGPESPLSAWTLRHLGDAMDVGATL
jgi:hypothetical protein